MPLTGNPALKGLMEGRWLFWSVPIIDVDSSAALRKRVETGLDNHSSCHILSHESTVTLILHLAEPSDVQILYVSYASSSYSSEHVLQLDCSPSYKPHTYTSFPLFFGFTSSLPLHMSKSPPPPRSRYNLFHNNNLCCIKLCTKHLNMYHHT